MNLYLDTSAAMKLLVDEAESSVLADELDRLQPDDRLVASWLLHTELSCAAARHPTVVRPEAVAAVLARVVLVDLVRSDLVEAPVVGEGLRSQDALHLAVAIRVGVDSMLSYDDELASAARARGLGVVRPE